MVGLLHHRPEDPLDFMDVCLDRAREIGWKNIRWNTFVEEKEGNNYFLCTTVLLRSLFAHHVICFQWKFSSEQAFLFIFMPTQLISVVPTLRPAIGLLHARLSVTVRLSVTKCSVVNRYILQQKCLMKKWIGSPPQGTRLFIFQHSTPTQSLKLPTSWTTDVGAIWRIH